MKKRKAGRKPHKTGKKGRVELHPTAKELAYMDDMVGLGTYGNDRPSVAMFLLRTEFNELIDKGRIANRPEASAPEPAKPTEALPK
jgi:hypothetical protein